jgi:PAS domain S-box-containing protein
VRTSLEWKHQLGYEEHEIGDAIEDWHRRLHPEDFERVTRAFAEFAANPQGDLIVEERLLHRDGTYRWIVVRGKVVTDANGMPQRMLGSHVDITERMKVEFSLRESEARYRDLVNELEARIAQRTSELTEAYSGSQSFAYAVAHDLKAPLRAMNSFSQLLTQSAATRLHADELQYLKRINDGSVQMALLIDALLKYSRLEHRELSLCVVDCRALVGDVVHSMEQSIAASNAMIAITVAAQCEVRADAEGLRIVFRNLLDNALKFASPDRRPHIEIGSHAVADRVVLTVRDNGIGFDPQYHDKIFEIFNRLHARGYDGTGIGLALVRKALQRMHGEIWAESQLGSGATFYVSLPLATTDEAADSEPDVWSVKPEMAETHPRE